ncbi:MAG: tetratricopeptide repeat protein [Formivibrio sp.]|nr:tetratricopeptide repeat protein [Formivibrio sp.]
MKVAAEKTYRIALMVLLVLVLANALAAGLRTVFDNDMGWHLATGRWVVQHHAVPSTDVLSYTAAGAKWIYPPFAGVLMYLIYSAAGYAGLSAFCALACVATIAYIVRRRDLASLVLAMCAVERIALRTGPRADLFSTVFMALFLGELWAYHRGLSKRLWVLPLTMLFWVNLHPGFVLGLAVIGAYLLLEGGELLFAARRADATQRLREAWPWLAGTAAVTLLNPWGIKLYSASLALAGLGRAQQGAYNANAFINEYLPVPLSTHLLKLLVDFRHPDNGYVWLMLIAIVVIALALWRKQPGVVIILSAALYISLQHARYITFFCITTTIIGATLLGEAFGIDGADAEARKGSPKPASLLRIPQTLAVVFICAVGTITALHAVDIVSNRTHVVFHSVSRFGLGESSWYPERAASFIRHERLPGNIFEEYAMGGFAAWRLGPEYPDFIDGRSVSPAILVEEQKLRAQPPDSPDWQAAADRWGFNVLLIPEGEGAVDRQDALAFCQSEFWKPVYMDERALVLLRNTPANQPWLDHLQIDCRTQQLVPPPASAPRKDLYDFWTDAGGLLFALQRDQESEAALLSAEALYPQDPNVRLILARLYQRHQMFDKAEAECQISLGLRESHGAWFELGGLYVQQRRFPEAALAFSSAAHLSGNPYTAYMNLAQVELRLQHPEEALQAYAEAEKSSPYRNGAEGLAPDFYADIADGRANAQRMLSHLSQAIKFEQEALRLNPSVANRWKKLAYLLEASGQLDLSRQAGQRALELGAVQR